MGDIYLAVSFSICAGISWAQELCWGFELQAVLCRLVDFHDGPFVGIGSCLFVKPDLK